ncbi:hypothetical protein [Algibacillus agarilyticus]|nr:hypothetical protein [Algibacillus agarilyticus]
MINTNNKHNAETIAETGEVQWTVPYSMLFPVIQSMLDDDTRLL